MERKSYYLSIHEIVSGADGGESWFQLVVQPFDRIIFFQETDRI
jgi:hypothetical protein